MAKQTNSRAPAPAAQNVPWAQPQDTPAMQDLAGAFEEQPNGLSEVENNDHGQIPPPPVISDRTEVPKINDPAPTFDPYNVASDMGERIRAAFAGEPMPQKSPFAPQPKVQEVVKIPHYEMGDAPLWGDLVRFVQKHGEKILQVRYPQPKGGCIDTLWKGIQVFPHATCEIRHEKFGWITWEDCQYTE